MECDTCAALISPGRAMGKDFGLAGIVDLSFKGSVEVLHTDREGGRRKKNLDQVESRQ